MKRKDRTVLIKLNLTGKLKFLLYQTVMLMVHASFVGKNKSFLWNLGPKMVEAKIGLKAPKI